MNQIDLVTHYQLVGAQRALQRVIELSVPSDATILEYVELRLALEMLNMALLALEPLPISGAQ